MALTTHWEWRGFGRVSAAFRKRFLELECIFDDETPRPFTDEYLWIPEVDVNLKFRTGTQTQDGLKFKRFHERRGDLEKWTESREEIFPFPLCSNAWELLRREMDAAFNPPLNADREEAVRFLKSVDPEITTFTLQKERQSRTWGHDGKVKVEIAEVFTPKRTTTIGLEVWDPMRRFDDSGCLGLLERALKDLRVRDEAVEVMNYLEFIRGCALVRS